MEIREDDWLLLDEMAAGPSSAISPSLLGVATAVMRERRARTVVIPGWILRILGVLSRVMTRRTWTAMVFLFGTFDMLLAIFYLVRTSHQEFAYALVIGPPPTHYWVPLCFFTVLRILLYFPESANTFSSLRSPEGETYLPLHLELICAMSVVHIPLGISDFLLSRCWRNRPNNIGSLVHITRLAFLSLRIVWYAHIEGRKCRKNDKHEIQQATVLICCTLFAVLTSFPVSSLRWKQNTVLEKELESASIFLVHHPSPPQQRYPGGFECAFGMCSNAHEYYDRKCLDGSSLNDFSGHRWRRLVRSVRDIYNAHPARNFSARFCCNASTSPKECNTDPEEAGVGHSAGCQLRFRFAYAPEAHLLPYGLVAYNYARLCGSHANCTNSQTDLSDGWQLVYYRSQSTISNVSLAFHKAYIQPKPMYDSTIDACSYPDNDVHDVDFRTIVQSLSWPCSQRVTKM